MKVLSLCDGGGGAAISLMELGVEFPLVIGVGQTGNEYYGVENDKHARKVADYNLPFINRAADDVTSITRAWVKKYGPFDLITFGSPCQSLSNLGSRQGLDGKSRIFLDCFRVLQWALEFNPKAKYLIENVKMQEKFKKEFDKYLGSEGKLINSNLVSPQNRERYYWSNFPLPEIERELNPINSILDSAGPKLMALNYSSSTRYVDDAGKVYSSPRPGRLSISERRAYFSHKSNTLVTGTGCANNKSGTVVVTIPEGTDFPTKGHIFRHDNKPVSKVLTELYGKDVAHRGLSVSECAKLQTIPAWYLFTPISNNQAYKVLGNGWTIEVIKKLLAGVI
jgi:site-specific DNA-cytosine methylase